MSLRCQTRNIPIFEPYYEKIDKEVGNKGAKDEFWKQEFFIIFDYYSRVTDKLHFDYSVQPNFSWERM